MKGKPLCVLLTCCAALVADDASLKALYDGHRWLDLREAIAGRDASPLYRGAVASAFNNLVDAERYLNAAIQQATSPDEIEEARGTLVNFYVRLGQHRNVVHQLDKMLKLKPHRSDFKAARSLFGVFSRYPDQTVGLNRHSVVQFRKNDSLPVAINGKALYWIVDTGANVSMISQSEARMLGLKVERVPSKASDLNGGSTNIGATVAPKLTLGEVEIYNVPLMVLPDSQPPVNELPPGQRGIIGLPIVIAWQRVRWTAGGTFEVGFNSCSNGAGNNLYFDGLAVVTRVGVEGQQLDFIFDTGNGAGTQLWQSFANDFAGLLKKHGARSKKRVTQIGGSQEREVVVLPELRLRVGGLETILRPANIFSRPVGNEYQHGLLGTDLLSQAAEVSIDFGSMSVRLR
jgi:predicted aspartyl protease